MSAWDNWKALGAILVILLGLGLINATTRRIAIIAAIALAIPLALKAQRL